MWYAIFLCNNFHISGPMFDFEIGLWHVVAVVTFPGSFLKQVVSLVQLIVASKNIGVFDSSERKKRRTLK